MRFLGTFVSSIYVVAPLVLGESSTHRIIQRSSSLVTALNDGSTMPQSVSAYAFMISILAVDTIVAVRPAVSSCLEQRLSWYGEPSLLASCGVLYSDSRHFPMPCQHREEKKEENSV
ncbi:hypothetical protein LZ31DRAFT_57109 [Colletotrichum somersetense]|nr:hypothetical protein LZ31DRAFT_57109 [Colletotrichum somersetense]